MTKCELGKDSLKFLGHIIGHGHIQPNPDKIDALMKQPLPKTNKQVLSFLGLASYYRKFVKDFAKIASPLIVLTMDKDNFV